MYRVKIGERIRAFNWDGSLMGEGPVETFSSDLTPMLYCDCPNGRILLIAAYGWERV